MTSYIRNYSIASLIVIAVAAATIIVLYRAIVIRGIETIAESSSAATGHIALQPIRTDRKSTRLNSSHSQQSRMPSSA